MNAPPKQQDPCASLSRADLCDRNTITLPGVEVCSHACAQEMIACIDSPRLANYRMEIESLQVRCRSDSAECLPMVSPATRHLTMSLSDADVAADQIGQLDAIFDENCCKGSDTFHSIMTAEGEALVVPLSEHVRLVVVVVGSPLAGIFRP